jgi:hypothetical protein
MALLMASRGSNGRPAPSISDAPIEAALEPNLAALLAAGGGVGGL